MNQQAAWNNTFPRWKNLLVLAVVLVAGMFAVPNLFPTDPALQIARDDGEPEAGLLARVEQMLGAEQQSFRAIGEDGDQVFVVFDEDAPLKGGADGTADALRAKLGKDYGVALTQRARLPGWLRALGLKPIALGLDLRGGVHFLYEVDLSSVMSKGITQVERDAKAALRNERLSYKEVSRRANGIQVSFEQAATADEAARELGGAIEGMDFRRSADGGTPLVIGEFTELAIKDRQDQAIEQNLTTLRRRVDELGVAEPLVQRSGVNRIVIELPGVSDPNQAARIIGATATLEFRLADTEHSPTEADRTGRAPFGTRLYYERDGNPILLKRTVIVTGDNLTGASSGIASDSGTPAVFVNLDAQGGSRMQKTTAANIDKPMAVVFVETEPRKVIRDGQEEIRTEITETVISVATIRGVFSRRFQITGVLPNEASDLALLLRAGSLAAPIYKVEERTIGPSLGKDNIVKGSTAVGIGFLLVVLFMAVYYRVFGLVANAALFINLVMIVSLLSLLQAALSLPGIAGIVLTVGMSVDANVLIFERIREELKSGNTIQSAIHSGYEKAFSTIADANITTAIAALVLWVFGTGPIRGFAVTLFLGILTSMFTAIVGTRAVINLIYGGRKVEKLAI